MGAEGFSKLGKKEGALKQSTNVRLLYQLFQPKI